MSTLKELNDEELVKISGGDNGSMQEVYNYANGLFLEILAKGGTIEELDNVKKLANEMIEKYNKIECKIMNIERPIIEAQIQALYESFVSQLNN